MTQTKIRKEHLNTLQHFQVRLLDVLANQSVGTSIGGEYRIAVNYPITILNVGAYCDTAGTTGLATFDINEGGVSILSTKITLDSGEKTSATAATPPVISDSAIAANSIITFDIDTIQTTAAKGLVVWIDFVYNI